MYSKKWQLPAIHLRSIQGDAGGLKMMKPNSQSTLKADVKQHLLLHYAENELVSQDTAQRKVHTSQHDTSLMMSRTLKSNIV